MILVKHHLYFFLDVPEKKDDEIETAKREEEIIEKTEGTIKLSLTHLHVFL